ncbi:MAG: formylglycine-generating enzyme family protein [Desulfocapsaceae bacterium]
MVKQTKSIKSVLLVTLVTLLLAFFLGAVTGCGPGTAGYGGQSGELEDHQSTSLMEGSEDSNRGKTISNSVGMHFVYIPPGSYLRGSPPDEVGRTIDEEQHKVTLSNGYYLQTTEVTQKQWKTVMEALPRFIRTCSEECPVERLSWEDAQAFIRQLNKLEGVDYYRLPTEAEWEYAARAGSITAFANGEITDAACGDPTLSEIGWYCGNSKSYPHHPVAQKVPNSWGIYDMHGSVWEWCNDWYSSYPQGSVTDPSGPPDGRERVIRGGGLGDNARSCRSANRLSHESDIIIDNIGLRLVRSP